MGARPNCCSMLSWSTVAQCSTTLPLANRPIWISVQIAVLPVAFIPWKSPFIVPRTDMRPTTCSPSAMRSSTVYLRSGKAVVSAPKNALKLAMPAGLPGGAAWSTNSAPKYWSAASRVLVLITFSAMARKAALLNSDILVLLRNRCMERQTRASADGASLRWGGQMLAASSSTHASPGAPGGTALVVGRAERRGVWTVTGCMPSGVMLLGATHTIAHTREKVKYFFTRGEVRVTPSLGSTTSSLAELRRTGVLQGRVMTASPSQDHRVPHAQERRRYHRRGQAPRSEERRVAKECR